MNWDNQSIEATLTALDSGREGLSTEEARRRLEQYGPNELREMARLNPLRLLVRQFMSPLIYLLLIAAGISILLGHAIDAAVILAVVLLNGVVGFIQESKAEEAIRALQEIAAPRAMILRDGRPQMLDAREIVPGDVILLESGVRVSADSRLIEAATLHADESVLTGESVPVEKTTAPLPEHVPLAEMTNMVWLGTAITYGRGAALVCATGANTEVGKIATSVETLETVDTPLQQQMSRLTRTLGYLALGLAGLIFVGGLLRGFPLFDMFLFTVATAVAAIPEGLVAIVTIVLALGVRRMAQRHVIIRRLPAVETLGSATVICTDKTGTLTMNQMTVKKVFVDGLFLDVTGEGYDLRGEYRLDQGPIHPSDVPDLELLLRIAVLANDAKLNQVDGRYEIAGDPTEGSLVVAAAKAGLGKAELERDWARISEIPFQSELGYMATLNQAPLVQKRKLVHVKGAPERLIEMCQHLRKEGKEIELGTVERQQLSEASQVMARNALRVLGFAYAEFSNDSDSFDPAALAKGLVFVGLIGMIDPPREEAKQAIASAQEAGIRVMMITGDAPVTATAIGGQLGLAGRTLSGFDVENSGDENLSDLAAETAIFARVAPEHKLRIISALQKRNHIVAMTGDGVNDAPALKKADIGVAMGLTGTDVAREASDMVLTDDNFASIVGAVEEGRTIFHNIRRVVFYLLGTNGGEVLMLGTALLLGLPLPLVAVQILFINLVTDAFYDIGLGLEPKHENVLREPPRPFGEPIITRRMLYRLIMVAVVMAAGTLALFAWELSISSIEKARTIAFTTIAAFQWFNAFNSRSTSIPLYRLGLFTNIWLPLAFIVTATLQALVIYVPVLQGFFRTVPLDLTDWLIIIGISSTILFLEELRKTFFPKLFS